MKIITYLFTRLIAAIMAILPFRAAYFFADLLYLILFHLVSYRKKVVMENISRAFPEKNAEERRKIMRGFYRYLSDLMVEGLKGISMTKKQVLKRHRMTNAEMLHPYFEKGKSVIGVTGHYGNWEWGALSGGLQVQHRMIALYKPLSNQYLDAYMKRRRAKYDCHLASIKETYSTFENNQHQVSAYMLVADQSPSNLKDAIWTRFLNQDTACLHGPEKYARLYRLPVFYVDIQRKRRGFYEMELSLLAEDAGSMETGELTTLFMKRLEEKIRQRPEYWLWSHKRWKHKRDQMD